MSRKNRLRLIGVIAAAVMALTAVAAQAASAATWNVGGSPLGSGVSKNIIPNLELQTGSKFTGTISGTEVEMSATGLEVSSGKITQSGSVAAASGTLKFTGISLQKPVGCSPPSSISTVALTGELVPGTGGPFLKVKPASGTTFATVTLTGTCAIAGTPFKITTASYECLKTNAFSTFAVKQPISTSPTILSECGGELKAGGNPATLTGSGFARLEAEPSWGATNP